MKEKFLIEIAELYAMQHSLDEDIRQRHKLTENQTLPNRWLALLTELGELANETRCFKYWSTKNMSPRTKILDEYGDCLHFILSIGLTWKQDRKFYDIKMFKPIVNPTKDNQVKAFNNLFISINVAMQNKNDQNYQRILIDFFQLGIILGFNWDEIYQAYCHKNMINHERQINNY